MVLVFQEWLGFLYAAVKKRKRSMVLWLNKCFIDEWLERKGQTGLN